jgi:hypothetical protein
MRDMIDKAVSTATPKFVQGARPSPSQTTSKIPEGRNNSPRLQQKSGQIEARPTKPPADDPATLPAAPTEKRAKPNQRRKYWAAQEIEFQREIGTTIAPGPQDLALAVWIFRAFYGFAADPKWARHAQLTSSAI